MNVSCHLDSLAADLGDNPTDDSQYRRWPNKDLLRYWNEGICIVASQRPDLFSCPTVVKLKPGAIQDDLSPCNTIGRVLGQVDKHGNPIPGSTPVASSAALLDRWQGARTCALMTSPTAPYRMSSFSKDAQTQKMLVVDPPVPPGKDVYLQVTCVRSPATMCPGDDATDLDCGNMAAVYQWVLARAWFSSPEGSTEYNKSLAAFRMFFQLLNIKFRADLLYSLGIIPVGEQTRGFIDAGSARQ